MSEQILTPVGRLLWTQLDEPDENGKYSVKLAFEDSDELEALRDLATKTSLEKFGSVVKGLPFQDGNEQTNDDGQPWPWTKGKTIVNFRTKIKPGLVGAKGGDDTVQAADFYNGCYVRLVSDFYGWTYKAKKGVSASIHAVQFYRHGEKIGGRVKVDLDSAFGAAENDGTVNPMEA